MFAQEIKTEELRSFIDQYGPDSHGRICFVWNQKHAKDFVDANDTFRQHVIAAVIAEPDIANLDLVGDLFEAEAKWSKEAWCVRPTFSALGSILLQRGGTCQLGRFMEWFGVSMDTYCQCHCMKLDPASLASLLAEVERLLSKVTDDRQRANLEATQNLLAKLKSGNPMEGMFNVGSDQLGKVKVVNPSNGLIAKLRGFFGRR